MKVGYTLSTLLHIEQALWRYRIDPIYICSQGYWLLLLLGFIVPYIVGVVHGLQNALPWHLTIELHFALVYQVLEHLLFLWVNRRKYPLVFLYHREVKFVTFFLVLSLLELTLLFNGA